MTDLLDFLIYGMSGLSRVNSCVCERFMPRRPSELTSILLDTDDNHIIFNF
jgi:hypothetical protein